MLEALIAKGAFLVGVLAQALQVVGRDACIQPLSVGMGAFAWIASQREVERVGRDERIVRSLTSTDLNAYSVRNAGIIAKKKRSILYKNGHTLPASAERLLAEAQSNIQHSRKLGRNLQRANPAAARAVGTDAHHIVAREAAAAHPSRVLIFAV